MKTPFAAAIDWRRPRSVLSVLLLFVLVSLLFVVRLQPARADAGNPILGTIKASAVDNGDGTITVYVRGEWNWISHGGDCNFDRAATGVGIAWQDLNGPGTNAGSNETQRVTITGSPTGGTFKLKFNGATTAAIAYNATAAGLRSALEALSTVGPGNITVSGGPGPGAPWDVTFVNGLGKTDVPAMTVASKSFTGGSNPAVTVTTTTAGVNAVYNGFLVTKDGIRAYIGTSSEEFNGATSINPVDEMVHPVDRGNVPEGYTAAGTDYPSGQSFVDPSPPNPNSYTGWKGGCGREPLSDTSPNPPGDGSPGCGTTPASTACSGHPWGSWGYEKNGGKGYAHTYLKTKLPDRICVNFYDVHGGGSSAPKFQAVNGADEITVDGNGDNSIQTNSFNVNNGANCIQPPLPHITVTKTPHSQTITSGGTATWNIHVVNDGNVTLTNVHVTDGQATGCVRTSAQIASDRGNPPGATFAVGDTYDYSCSKANVTTAFKNVVVACGTFSTTDDTCDNSPATLAARTGNVALASTEQNFVPNDSATFSGLQNPNGKVRFRLYKGTDCTDATKLIYDSGDITVTANGTYEAGNTTLLKTLLANAGLPTATAGTYSWLVTYSNDPNNASITFACGTEKFVVTNS